MNQQQIDAYVARKQAQWERIQGALPHLSLSTDDRDTTFILGHSSEPNAEGMVDFTDRVVIGRLPRTVVQGDRLVIVPGVDATDKMIDRVIKGWRGKLKWERGDKNLRAADRDSPVESMPDIV